MSSVQQTGTRYRVPDHIVHRSFPAETVVLNLETGKYHGLNPTAGRMLETLDQLGSVDEAAAVLAAEYAQPLETVRTDLAAFCSDLAERGLIERV
jgi:Coenzyme PQQ synthesis protein D (PqqD)